MSRDACSSLLAALEGILIPRPPSRAGRANKAYSRSFLNNCIFS